MIVSKNRDLLNMGIQDFIISSEKVAHVQSMNNAEHALLVLTRTGYSAIPVLDMKYRLQGLLSMKMITESILGLEHIEFDKLSGIKVEAIMDKDVATLKYTDTFQRALELVINNAFLCVVDEDGMFMGILTRRVVLKQLKKYVYST
ncbi:MAG TPA: CBS domain-containing protein [Metalysinibacillus jejuensis]|uniref:CBS domain-containing protein n=1 Tax=Metalysinibacillus jejuensis TaxID=914327 RepID=A0A921T5I4_9BACL|nr:cyclic-di-AMP-binding protein CbpB [Metalysinibacillus jejuensis]HJH11496.1 CBS domain-containing protein [Metalysinibacillus jejuensis]